MNTDKRIAVDFLSWWGLRLSRRWVVFFLTSTLFVLSQFYRAAIAVITPQLITDLALTARELSFMSAAFFYAFALMQIPIALYLDRIGARRTMLALNLVAVAGALVFASATSAPQLIAARLALGVGMACNLMGTLKLISLWFTPTQFATLTTIVLSMGTAGNIFATTPLVLLVQAIGWRWAFVLVAGTNGLLALAFFLIARDRPDRNTVAGKTVTAAPELRDALAGLRNLFEKRDYWIISVSTFCRYGIYAAIQALYAGPFLINVMLLSAVETGNILFCMNLGFICGGPVFGTLSDRIFKTRKGIIIPGLGGMSVIIAILAGMPPGSGVPVLAGLFFALGIFNSTGGIMYAHIKEQMPLEASGAAMTGVNFFTMIGPAVFLQGLGIFMHRLYPDSALSPAAFNHAFMLCSLCLVAVALLYLFTVDRNHAP